MKIITVLFLVSFIFIEIIFSQNSISIFGGANITNVKCHLVDLTSNLDSSFLRKNIAVLPLMGIDVGFKMNERIWFTSGLGISYMGSRNYTPGLSGIYNVDKNLKLSFIRIPCIIEFNIIKDLKIEFGYSLNYTFRKNQNFFLRDDDNVSKSIFSPFHHAILFGIRKDIQSFSFVVNYHQGVSHIYDSKKINSENRIFMSLMGIQCTIGYLLSE
jgi:hypothetical protein